MRRVGPTLRVVGKFSSISSDKSVGAMTRSETNILMFIYIA